MRADKERKEQLRNLYKTEGLQACLKEADNNVEAITICEGTDYDYWKGSAKIIGTKYDEGFTKSEFNYIGEKCRQLFGHAAMCHRFKDGKEVDSKFAQAEQALKDLGF